MVKTLVAVMALVMGLVFAAYAQTSSSGESQGGSDKGLIEAGSEWLGKVTLPPAKPAQPGKPLAFQGVVDKVAGRVVTVKNATGARDFDISAALIQGYDDISMINAGDTVDVRYHEEGGRHVANVFVRSLVRTPAKKSTVPVLPPFNR
jgi:hypothetical protein